MIFAIGLSFMLIGINNKLYYFKYLIKPLII